MKKIIALAVAGAFVAPAFAADVNLVGEVEWSYLNGEIMNTTSALKDVTTTDLDGEFNIVASGEVGNGITVTADFLISDAGGAEGGNSLTFAGPFGKLDLGDANGAADSIDDVTDFGQVLSRGTGSGDAAVNLTLPTIVDGLSMYLSHSPVGTDGTTLEAKVSGGDADDSAYIANGSTSAAAVKGDLDGASGHDETGFAVKYDFGMGSVGYAKTEDGGDNDETLMNVVVSVSGITAAYETREQKSATLKIAGVTSAAKLEEKAIGLSYTAGDVTVAYESKEVESAGVLKQDFNTYGVHYTMGDVKFFAETSSEDEEGESLTAVGAIFKF